MLTVLILFAACKSRDSQRDNEPARSSPLTVIEEPQKRSTLFPQIHAHLNGMVSEFIFEIYQDTDSTFWFCTNHDGIIRYDGRELTKYTEKDGIGGSAVRCVVEDREGILWFGTSGGLTRYDGEKFQNFDFGGSDWENEIWATAIDEAGLIWVGGNDGVRTFDGNSFAEFIVPKPELENARPMIARQRVSGITVDRRGDIWFVNDGYGITRYDGQRFSFLTAQNGLTDNYAAAVFEDSRGDIWLGTYYGGVSRFDGEIFTNYTRNEVITGEEVYNFCEDRDGNIWFSAEEHGVYKYDGENFRQYTREDGLTNNAVQYIFADAKGQIWFCTWQGISIFDGRQISDVALKEPWTR